MSLKAKLEAIIYAAETPITLDHIVQLVKEFGGRGERGGGMRKTPRKSSRACAPR